MEISINCDYFYLIMISYADDNDPFCPTHRVKLIIAKTFKFSFSHIKTFGVYCILGHTCGQEGILSFDISLFITRLTVAALTLLKFKRSVLPNLSLKGYSKIYSICDFSVLI